MNRLGERVCNPRFNVATDGDRADQVLWRKSRRAGTGVPAPVSPVSAGRKCMRLAASCQQLSFSNGTPSFSVLRVNWFLFVHQGQPVHGFSRAPSLPVHASNIVAAVAAGPALVYDVGANVRHGGGGTTMQHSMQVASVVRTARQGEH